jgi:hypothetical protein
MERCILACAESPPDAVKDMLFSGGAEITCRIGVPVNKGHRDTLTETRLEAD